MKHSLETALMLSFFLLQSGCQPFVPVTDLSKVPKQEMRDASRIRIYMLGSSVVPPEIIDTLGEVTAYSCKHLLTDPPASKGDALKQLKLHALNMGANAIIDVSFDSRGTDTWGTNCWESVEASGTAVIIKQ